MTGRRILVAVLGKLAPAVSLAAAVVFFWAIAPDRTPSATDVKIILVQTVIVAMAALGMTLVIVSGGIDLSVGSSLALCGVVAAKVMLPDWGGAAAWQPVAAVGAAVAAGVACGLYNGLLHTWLKMPPFVVTLGTLGFFRGVAKWASDSTPVYSKAGWLEDWVAPMKEGRLLAPAVWMMLGLAVVMAGLMQRTTFGRRAVAIGSNEEAARRSGVPIARVKVMIYATCGLLVGLAGAMQFARLGGSGDPTVQVGLELKAIAAVVIGGASLSGGSASVVGTLCGAVLMAFLDNRCTALGWPNYVQELVVGHIIIGAVALDRWRRGRGAA